MSINVFKIAKEYPTNKIDNFAFLYITDIAINGCDTGVCFSNKDGWKAKMTLCANKYSEVFSVIADWLHHLDFLYDDIGVCIYSDSSSISSDDVLCIGHLVLPNAEMFNGNGKEVERFVGNPKNSQFNSKKSGIIINPKRYSAIGVINSSCTI